MRFILIAFLTLWALPAHAGLVDCFGEAADYNLFVFNDATLTNSDVEGSAAIGGDAILQNYLVGQQVVPGTDARLDVGGTLTYINGQVGPGGAGTIFTNSLGVLSGVNPGGVTIPTPVDFSGVESLVSGNSLLWSGLADTGTATTNFGALTLDAMGLGSGLQVFNIDASDIPASNNFNIKADTDATVLVNIAGSSAVFTNFGLFLDGGLEAKNIIFNVYEATDVTIGSVGLTLGAFIAPDAALSFNNGNLDGTVIVDSFKLTCPCSAAATICPRPLCRLPVHVLCFWAAC